MEFQINVSRKERSMKKTKVVTDRLLYDGNLCLELLFNLSLFVDFKINI